MKRMSIAEASEHFGVSKEAIHNRVRRGSLESVIEDGVKFVLIGEDVAQSSPRTAPRKTNNTDDRYYKFLEEQNLKLQERVEKLEDETRMLRDQKEQMLIEERERIENIYREKDEQLKNILNSFKEQFMLPQQEEEHLEAEIEDVEELESKEKSQEEEPTLISLKKYLKENNYSAKKCLKIEERFKKKAKKDERVIKVGKKFYLDLNRYDYRDLL